MARHYPAICRALQGSGGRPVQSWGIMLPMQAQARGFFVSLAASAGGATLSGIAAAIVVSLYPPGTGGASPALWGAVVLPVAVALVVAGALARHAAAVFLNSLAYLLPQLAAGLAVFFLFAHPGGAGGQGLILTTLEFWVKVAAAYAVVTVLVGIASLTFHFARR
jgi:hypothetical protein